MDLNPRQVVTQFAHLLQQNLFPLLESVVGPLSPQLKLLASTMSMAPLAGLLSARRASTGRPARDRAALATAFMAKAILNLPTTRDLISRLRVDESLRQFCGWSSVNALPHESKFSRAFAEFALTELPLRLHQAVIAATQSQRLIGHIARDSTAIPVREHFPDTPKQEAAKKKPKKGKRVSRKGQKNSFSKAKAADRGTRIQRQRHQTLDVMLSDLPRRCDIGVKKDHGGNELYWRGYMIRKWPSR